MAVAVVVLMGAVVFSYRRTVHAYPSGGGDYEVAQTNFGEQAGVIVAAALLTDYIVTVAVSVAAGVEAITSAEPALLPYKTASRSGWSSSSPCSTCAVYASRARRSRCRLTASSRRSSW